MPRRLAIELIVVVAAIAAAIALRAFVFGVYAIPSESMLPGLMTGDYLLVEKWPYGWARRSLPFARADARGRWRGALPSRGDIVVFKAPPAERRDYVKRVIGLPGDTIALRGGAIILDGRTLPRWRIADLVVPLAPNSPCRPAPGAAVRLERDAAGHATCRSPRYREMLPGGRTIDTLDLGPTEGDDFGPVRVPAGQLFVLGDDRDRSADSRWPAREGEAVGMVPLDDLVGRGTSIVFSVDGSARRGAVAGWARAVRWSRIGAGF